MIQFKRVYEDFAESDGYRVLVDRLWPRGIKKIDLKMDEWNKDITPSTELRKWYHANREQFEVFKGLYLAELEKAQDAWMPLITKMQTEMVTLLTAEKSPETQHASVLKAFLIEKSKQIKTPN